MKFDWETALKLTIDALFDDLTWNLAIAFTVFVGMMKFIVG